MREKKINIQKKFKVLLFFFFIKKRRRYNFDKIL